MKNFALAFLLTVALGLLVIMWREHRGQDLVVDQPSPATVTSSPQIVLLPPATPWQFKQGRIA